MQGRLWIVGGSLIAGVAVAAGAMGAHALQGVLDADQLDTYQVAVDYQFRHAIALVMVGLMALRQPGHWLNAAGWLFVAGTALFSGGIYFWLASSWPPAVHVVPIGGSTLIVAWLVLATAACRSFRNG